MQCPLIFIKYAQCSETSVIRHPGRSISLVHAIVAVLVVRHLGQARGWVAHEEKVTLSDRSDHVNDWADILLGT